MVINNNIIKENFSIKSSVKGDLKKPENYDNDTVTLSDPNSRDSSSYFYKSGYTKPEFEYSFDLSGKDSNESSVTIGIVHTNDEHDNNFKKFGREATLVRERENFYGDDNSFVVNLGDVTYNGNTKEKSSKYFGPVADIFNSMGVEFFVPGNHDFDHGVEFLEEKVLSHLNAVKLLGNVTDKNGKPVENTQAYRIEEINGVKVGFIGVTTPKGHGEDNKKEDFTVEPIMETVEKLVPVVKGEGAEVTVLLMHEGINTARTLAQSVPGLDVIIAGHDHKQDAEEVKNPDGRNTVIVEAGGNTNYVGDMAIKFAPSSKEIVKIDYKLFNTKGVTPDREVSDIINRFKN